MFTPAIASMTLGRDVCFGIVKNVVIGSSHSHVASRRRERGTYECMKSWCNACDSFLYLQIECAGDFWRRMAYYNGL